MTEDIAASSDGAPGFADFGRGTSQSGARLYNERLVLSLIRRHGSVPKAEIARLTGLSAQTASVIMRQLEADGLVLKGGPQRGRVGQPSVPFTLDPDGAFALGLKIGRRSSDIVLLDFLGAVRGERRLTHPYPTPAAVLAFGVALAVAATWLLAQFVNVLTASLALAGFYFYVFIYTRWLKRTTPQNIVIGGAAGALPPMVGWAAVTGDVGLASVVMFAIIFMWTPPHFWALALYRANDYARAGVPMLPVVAGHDSTRRHILAYTLALLPVSLLPVALGFAGAVYGGIALAVGGGFAWLAFRLWRDRSQRTATRTFRFSIVYLFAVLAALVLDRALSLAFPGLLGSIW